MPTMNKLEPVLKWTGSKRSQSDEIISYFPQKIRNYYEPFCGGCSVAKRLMDTESAVDTYILSDLNEHLISALEEIQKDYKPIVSYYAMMWDALKKIDGIDAKKEFYNKLRDKFNQGHDPLDFIVLNRLCYNGLIRYNAKGEFNSPFHFNRNGINPEKYKVILKDWHEAFNKNNVIFKCCDYRDFDFGDNDGDFVYFDPPYANSASVYNKPFSKEEFFDFLNGLEVGYAFSYNEGGEKIVPNTLYEYYIKIKSGNSSFKRLNGGNENHTVYETLFMNY